MNTDQTIDLLEAELAAVRIERDRARQCVRDLLAIVDRTGGYQQPAALWDIAHARSEVGK